MILCLLRILQQRHLINLIVIAGSPPPPPPHTEQPYKEERTAPAVRPWARLWARTLDTCLFAPIAHFWISTKGSDVFQSIRHKPLEYNMEYIEEGM
jgi:hypothetical protein